MARQSQNAGILQALKEGARITPMGALVFIPVRAFLDWYCYEGQN